MGYKSFYCFEESEKLSLGSKPFTPLAGKKGFFPKIYLFLGTCVSGDYKRLDLTS